MVSLGARPEAICAALGPSIGAGAFETDGDVPDALRAWLGRGAEEFIYTGAKAGKFNVDLRGANAHRLMSLGLRRENIAVSHRVHRRLPRKILVAPLLREAQAPPRQPVRRDTALKR